MCRSIIYGIWSMPLWRECTPHWESADDADNLLTALLHPGVWRISMTFNRFIFHGHFKLKWKRNYPYYSTRLMLGLSCHGANRNGCACRSCSAACGEHRPRYIGDILPKSQSSVCTSQRMSDMQRAQKRIWDHLPIWHTWSCHQWQQRRVHVDLVNHYLFLGA